MCFGAIAAAVGGNLIGGLLDNEGQKSANASSAKSAREQMAFQERMSNTSYQRGMEDMKKAGLNPMLAYMKGGASTPDGSKFEAKNEMAGLGEAAKQATMNAVQVQNIKASTAKSEAEAGKAVADADLSSAQAAEARARTINEPIKGALTKRQEQSEGYRYNVLMSEFSKNIETAGLTRQETENAREHLRNLIKEGNLLEIDRFMKELELPGLDAKSRSDQTGYGQNIRPYLRDAESLTSTAKAVASPAAAYYGSKAVSNVLRNAAKPKSSSTYKYGAHHD